MIAFIDSRSFAHRALDPHLLRTCGSTPGATWRASPTERRASTEDLSAHATEVNGYFVRPGEPPCSILANGVTIDYDQGMHGTLSWTPEIGSSSDGFWPPQSRIVPLAEENLAAFQRTALSAGAYARVLQVDVIDAGDADGFYEAGETVELAVSVRNGGLLATGGPVTVNLTSSSAGVTPVVASFDFGALAAFSGADTGATPLSFTLDAGIAGGTRVDYELTLSWDGLSETVPANLIAGQAVAFLFDDVEVDLGWSAGLPGDTATTGIWEFGDPVGTISGGQPSNPRGRRLSGCGGQRLRDRQRLDHGRR